MIAKYRNNYCCVDTSVSPIQIWKYESVEGFSRKTTRRGTVYYEKKVDASEIDELFDVAFAVKWNGIWFGCDYSPKSEEVRLFSDDLSVIKKYGFEEFERFSYDLYVDVSTCEEFEMTYRNYPTREEKSVSISKEEWQKLWKELVQDLIPH